MKHAEQFSESRGAEHVSVRAVRHHSIEELRDSAEASVAQVRVERTDERPSKIFSGRVVFQIGRYKLAEEPGPRHAAVAGFDALVEAAFEAAFEFIVARVERTQAVGRVQLVPA